MKKDFLQIPEIQNFKNKKYHGLKNPKYQKFLKK
jgi:hypothetical protein